MSRRGATERAVLLACAVLFAVFIVFSTSPVQAASVTISITVNVAEPGAPSFTWTVTGCSASPSSGTSGVPQAVIMNQGCTYTISPQNPKGNGTLRDRLTNGYFSSVSGKSCSSGTCAPVTITAHSQEFLSIGQSCDTPATSATSPTSDDWFNYGTTLSVSCHGVWNRSSGTGSRATSWNWDGGPNTKVSTTGVYSTSSRVMNTHHVLNVNKATQYMLTLDTGSYSALVSVTSPTISGDKYWYDTGTSVTYLGYGIFGRTGGVGNRSISWSLDSAFPASLLTTGGFSISTSMGAPHTIHVAIVEQVEVTLDINSNKFLLEIGPPTLTGDDYWYDVGTPVTVALAGIENRGGGTGTRLVSYSINGGESVQTNTTSTVFVLDTTPIASKQFITSLSTTQYQLSLDKEATVDLASVTPPPIPGDDYWYDSGTRVTLAGNGVVGRTSGVGTRITSWWLDTNPPSNVMTTGTFTAVFDMTASHLVHVQGTTQYELILSGSHGAASVTSPTIPGDDYWYDAGTSVSLSMQDEFGRTAGVGWRMVSYSVDGGPSVGANIGAEVAIFNGLTMNAPHSVSISAVRQYQVTIDSALSKALYTISAPTIPGDDYWYDAGSAVDVTVLGAWGRNSTMGYRLISFSINDTRVSLIATSGTVTVLALNEIEGAQSITSSSTIQYPLAVFGGSGSTINTPPPIPGDKGWYDSGASVTVSTNGSYNVGSQSRQRITSWSIDGGQPQPAGVSPIVTTSSIVMNGPHFVTFNSKTQFLVNIVVKDSSGFVTLTPENILLQVGAGTVLANSGEAWVDAFSNMSASTIIWQGLDVAPTNTAHYVVASPFTITVDARVYDATIRVKDALGFGVGGAAATITLANGTTFQTTANGDGEIALRLLPLGPFQASITSLGFSTTISADASKTGVFTANVILGVTSIIVVVVIAVILITVFLIARRMYDNWKLNKFFSHAGDETPQPADAGEPEEPPQS